MAAKPPKDEEITDSTDWLSTPLPKLASVDSALRCQVCKEYFRTPMITSCFHTFCSICIRRCLNNDSKCPVCRTDDQPMRLRPNAAMEDLVEAFTAARQQVLDFARALQGSTKRKRDMEENVTEGIPAKKTRSSGRITRNSQLTVLDSEGDDDEYIPEDEIPKDGKVACPICQGRFATENAVSLHLDTGCNGKPPPSTQKQTSKSTQISISSASHPISKPMKQPDRLPQPHFTSFKDPVLRKKLSELGLSAGGSRQALEKRYSEWVLIWNANCDSKNPKPKIELKRDLNIWEKTQGDGALTSAMGSHIKDKDFDKEAWSAQNNNTFNNLIAEARAKAALRRAKQAQASDSESAQGSIGGDSSPSSILPPSRRPSEPGREKSLGGPMPLPQSLEFTPQNNIPRQPSPMKPSLQSFQKS